MATSMHQLTRPRSAADAKAIVGNDQYTARTSTPRTASRASSGTAPRSRRCSRSSNAWRRPMPPCSSWGKPAPAKNSWRGPFISGPTGRPRAFIRVNCAAIPAGAARLRTVRARERRLHRGATRRLGRFEAAHGGTLFLDEIGDLPAETQIALLRVLQEREFERLGSNQPIAMDVRLWRRRTAICRRRCHRHLPPGPLLSTTMSSPSRCPRCASAWTTFRYSSRI